MKTVLETLCVAFSMFSRLPAPQVEWNARNMKYMLCAFPLVGGAIGLALWGWAALAAALGLGTALWAAGVTLLPVAVTGGIHLDGLCDTCDALASQGDPARRREILKDPHSGAFAVIGLGCWLLLYWALAAELPAAGRTALLLTLFHVLSRALSGATVLLFPAADGKPGLLRTFRDAAEGRRAVIPLLALAALCAAGLVLRFRLPGGAALCAAALCLLWLRRMSARKFGGMSGDLSGWFLQVCELLMLAAYIFAEKAVML